MGAMLSAKLLYEYLTESDDDNEEGKADASPESGLYKQVSSTEDGGVELANRNVMAGAPEIDSPFKQEEALDKADKEKQKTLFMIAFIGSVDDLTPFVPMLVGKGFDIVQLIVGALVAAFTIVMICVF